MAPANSSSTSRVGRHAPKVKTACLTCKRRRVKCDETRPVCTRCEKGGFYCCGYGIWGGGSGTASSSAMVATTNLKSMARLPDNDLIVQEVQTARARLGSVANVRPHRMQLPSPPISVCDEKDEAVEEVDNLIPSERTMIDANQLAPVVNDFDWSALLNDPRPMLSIPPSLLDLSCGSNERSLLDWFKCITAGKLPGIFCSEFWTILLPQACHTEPAVLHGVLALTSAHKSELMLPESRQALQAEQVTLQSYTKAIIHVRPHICDETKRSMQVTLMACILFACLELIRKRYTIAANHLSSGLNLAAQAAKRAPQAVDHTTRLITATLLKISLQISIFVSDSGVATIIDDHVSNFVAPIIFFTVEDARDALDVLTARASRVTKQFRRAEEDYNELLNRRYMLREDLRNWLKTYTASYLDSNAALSPKSRAATLVLKMYYTMTVIITETGHKPGSEILYDEHIPRFRQILNEATKMWCAVAASHRIYGSQFPGDLHASIIDVGWIPAVYFVAIKCRVHELRVHAIRLLEATHHTEGMWNAPMAARVACEVMRLEEGPDFRLQDSDVAPFDGSMPAETFASPHIIAFRRLQDVEMVPPIDHYAMSSFNYKIKGDDGVVRVMSRSFDPVASRWIEAT